MSATQTATTPSASTARSPLIRRLELLGPFDLARSAGFSFGPDDAAAFDGRLDTFDLRRLPVPEEWAVLQTLDGIGPFYAELTAVRALGHTDVLPANEPRVRARLGELLGRSEPVEQAEFAALAERWRPWRTWACVHIRAVDPPARPPGA